MFLQRPLSLSSSQMRSKCYERFPACSCPKKKVSFCFVVLLDTFVMNKLELKPLAVYENWTERSLPPHIPNTKYLQAPKFQRLLWKNKQLVLSHICQENQSYFTTFFNMFVLILVIFFLYCKLFTL